MTNKKMNYAASIKYRSRDKVDKKPEIFTTGGYSALDSKGEEIFFDWNNMKGYSNLTEDGHVEIDATLTSFDSDVFGDGEPLEFISAAELANAELTEVYVQCYQDNNEEEFIFLDVISFEVYDRSTEETFAFGEDNLAHINQLNYKEYKG